LQHGQVWGDGSEQASMMPVAYLLPHASDIVMACTQHSKPPLPDFVFFSSFICCTQFKSIDEVVELLQSAAQHSDSSQRAEDRICSRFFAPWSGIAEDPVTGSAHSVLAAYFAETMGRKSFNALQCSKRQGALQLTAAEAVDASHVVVSGSAVTVMRGTLLVP
jgi:hypothetical protein